MLIWGMGASEDASGIKKYWIWIHHYIVDVPLAFCFVIALMLLVLCDDLYLTTLLILFLTLRNSFLYKKVFKNLSSEFPFGWKSSLHGTLDLHLG